MSWLRNGLWKFEFELKSEVFLERTSWTSYSHKMNNSEDAARSSHAACQTRTSADASLPAAMPHLPPSMHCSYDSPRQSVDNIIRQDFRTLPFLSGARFAWQKEAARFSSSFIITVRLSISSSLWLAMMNLVQCRCARELRKKQRGIDKLTLFFCSQQ